MNEAGNQKPDLISRSLIRAHPAQRLGPPSWFAIATTSAEPWRSVLWGSRRSPGPLRLPECRANRVERDKAGASRTHRESED